MFTLTYTGRFTARFRRREPSAESFLVQLGVAILAALVTARITCMMFGNNQNGGPIILFICGPLLVASLRVRKNREPIRSSLFGNSRLIWVAPVMGEYKKEQLYV
jgi:hypothetical protein